MKRIDNRGFTLLEIIIVVAILAILAGVSVPYYQDYITDARINALRQNLANFRRVLEDFKGDHGRGPFRGTVYRGGVAYDCSFLTNNNELVAGVVPPVSATYSDRRHKYIPAMPLLEDPYTGEKLTMTLVSTGSLYFVNTGGVVNGANGFEIDKDACYKNYDVTNIDFENGKDEIVSGSVTIFAAVGAGNGTWSADVTSVYVTDSKGNKW